MPPAPGGSDRRRGRRTAPKAGDGVLIERSRPRDVKDPPRPQTHGRWTKMRRRRITLGGATVQAWVVHEPGPIDMGPLAPVERADPEPGPGEVRIRVSTCGVCRTDLHLAEGTLPPHHPGTIPGHQAVGVVDRIGPNAKRFAEGDRIGIAWLRHTDG